MAVGPMNRPVLPQSKEGISHKGKDNRNHTEEASFMCTHSSGGKGKRAQGSQTVESNVRAEREQVAAAQLSLRKVPEKLTFPCSGVPTKPFPALQCRKLVPCYGHVIYNLV